MLSLIVAISDNQVIGLNGELPWHLSADLKRFKQLTMGHHIVMGRKTFDSICRPLPGRTSIVLTRQVDWMVEGVLKATDLQSALTLAGDDDEVFVIGGSQVYQLALPIVDRLYVTRVHATVDGDTYFPDITTDHWQLQQTESHAADEKNDHDYSFIVYARIHSQD
ncbi:MAG TPA: dihydrofolate reductase [Planctomycetaceae bacterium]|nr:dihydrofolate reductase [Planctomycetaceae bacterium]